MYDHRGNEVDPDLDAKVEKEFNALLDRISKEDEARSARIHGEVDNERRSTTKSNGLGSGSGARTKRTTSKGKGRGTKAQRPKQGHSSLGEVLESYLKANRDRMSEEEHNLWHWHFSNLEYSNAADLNKLSLTHWDQDDEFALSGDHCLIQEGYGRIIEAMKRGLDIRYNHIVTKVDWTDDAVKVITKRNDEQSDEMRSSQPSSSALDSDSKDDGDRDGDGDDAEKKPVRRTLDNLQRIELTQKREADSHSDSDSMSMSKTKGDDSGTERIPIYAMLRHRERTHSVDATHRFVKLDDIEGRAVYAEQHEVDGEHEANGTVAEDVEEDDNLTESDTECFVADAVVVTLPLGVLKRGDVEFVPALPRWKEAAIQSMGFGLLNKVFLRFDGVFWDIDSDYIGFASSVHGEFYLFVNLVPVTGTPVLMSLVSGSFAERLEEADDRETVHRAMTVLRGIFGDDDVMEPIDFCVTRWGQDRFSRGSYSFIATGCNGEHYEKLSYSVRDKLYFGGEHTIRKWPASVHGAYLSGIREARKIMNTHYIHRDTVGTTAGSQRGGLTDDVEHGDSELMTLKAHKSPSSASWNGPASTSSSRKLSAFLLKAGLTELPTDTMFEPIKEQPLRLSARNNFNNKYSSSNRSKKKRAATLKATQRKRSASSSSSGTMRRKRRTRSAIAISSEGEEDGDGDSNQDEHGAVGDGSGSSDDVLSCSLCGGTGYLWDEDPKDTLSSSAGGVPGKEGPEMNGNSDGDGNLTRNRNRNWNRNRSRNRNRKLIGPFVLDSDRSSWCFIHFGCGLWSPDVHHQEDQWYNVTSCIRRSRLIRCCFCGEYGASVHCHNVHCLSSYHPQCAHLSQRWDFDRPDEGHLFFCIRHRTEPLTLHIEPHRSSIQPMHRNRPNLLRSPRPPAITK